MSGLGTAETAALASSAGVAGLTVGAVVARGWWSGVRMPPAAVAVVTGAAFGGLALRFGWSWTLPAEATFVAGALVLGGCDLDRLVLPKRIVYRTGLATGAWLLVAVGAGGSWPRLGVAAACSVAAVFAFAAVNLANPRWLGFGDVRFAGVVGLAVGWVGPGDALVGFLLASGLGLLAAVGLLAAGRATTRTPLPFGLFLAVGAVGALLGGQLVAG